MVYYSHMDPTFGKRSNSKKKLYIILAVCLALVIAGGGIAFAIQSSTTRISESKDQPKTESVSEIKDEDRALDFDDSEVTEEDTGISPQNPDQTVSDTPDYDDNYQPPQPSYTPEPTPRRSSAPVEVAACNETMKASYTNLYNSKITAENTRWANQQDAIRADAQRRGMGFSGIVDEQINSARPAHEANLASIENQYVQNLMSVNCL